MKQISSLLTAVVLLCGGGMANGQESERFKATKIKAEQGDAEEQFNLGVMYLEGERVPQDYVKAAKWFRKAAEQGDAMVQRDLGEMYYFGKGVPQDDAEASKWYRKAAEQGDAIAQFNLGGMYHSGEGVPKNYAEAMKWFRKAAEQGIAEAQFWVGVMCAKGEGVPKNEVEAYAWVLLAKANGFEKSSEGISIYEKVFTLEQIKKGQARALELQRLIEERKENPKPSRRQRRDDFNDF